MRLLNCFGWASLLAVSVSAQVLVSSPQAKLQTSLSQDASGQLLYAVQFNGRQVLASSPLGLTIDGVQFGLGDQLGKVSRHSLKEKFPWRGNKSEVSVRANAADVALKSRSGAAWQVQLRCFDDAVAWRLIVPGSGSRKLSGEASAWLWPAGAAAWCNPNTANGEGHHTRYDISQIPPTKYTNGIALPLTVELPGGDFAALSEADVMGYSGMTLEPTGQSRLNASFRDDPKGWSMEGDICSPWRVLMVAANLNDLVNCDAVAALCPAPDKALFPKGIKTDYLKPGRCLWQWWAYNDPGTHWSKQKGFVDQAAALNCAYYLVDEGWEHTRQEWAVNGITTWQRMKELCDYAAPKGVGIWVWRGWRLDAKRQWPGLETQEKREEFFRNCAQAGVKGTKIDFMDSESHALLAFYQACLSTAAKYKIMVNFHGANKPAGESRTWPNEMTREGVRGLENNKWDRLPPEHYATVPFTRYLAGHGDFTPTTFQPEYLKGTTVALQLASAVVTTSPILCWADKPDVYLQSPAADIIRSLPAVWDETRVLPGSKIGDLAILARRSGKDWYVGIVNGGAARSGSLELSFLGKGNFSADLFGDTAAEPTQFDIQRNVAVTAKTVRSYNLAGGGGLLVRLRPAAAPH